MMRSNGVPSEKERQFNLGDVVLCRYSSYPYWPATVDQTHQSRFKGKHFAMLQTRSGDRVPCFWCTFADEDSGGWVRADRMVLFHPDIVNKIRVDKENDWHDDQKEAIESALKSFKEFHKDTMRDAPQLPSDLAEGKHNGKWDATDKDDILSDNEQFPEEDEDPMDLGGSDDEADGRPPKRQGRVTKAEKTPARPKAKKEPRKTPKRKSPPAEEPRPKKRAKAASKLEKDLLDSIDNDPEEPRRKSRDGDVEEEVVDRSAGKRRRHSHSHSSESMKKSRKIELELANAKETIASLKKTIKKKEKALAELTGNGAGVACVMPPMPPPVQQALPSREEYRSVPVDSEKFNAMMDSLMENYDDFKKSAESADQARTELEKTMETIKKLYDEACNKVSSAEEKAAENERDLVRDLRGILEADVTVNNLRERKAGHVVRAMLKKCKDLPAIRAFCEAIYKSWKAQVTNYMKENDGKLKQESPKGVKPTGDKDDAKSSESPSAEANTSSKEKAEEEDRTDSPVDKDEKPSSKADDKDVVMKEGKSDGEDAPDDKETARAKVEESVEVKEEKKKTPDEKTGLSAKDDNPKGKNKMTEEPEDSDNPQVHGEASKPGDPSKPESSKPEEADASKKPRKESSEESKEKSPSGDDAKRQDSAAQEAPDSGKTKKSDPDSTMED